MASLSARLASRGKSSEIWIPGTAVEIGLNELCGFGSHVSIWLGPPSRKSKMQDWALFFVDGLFVGVASDVFVAGSLAVKRR